MKKKRKRTKSENNAETSLNEATTLDSHQERGMSLVHPASRHNIVIKQEMVSPGSAAGKDIHKDKGDSVTSKGKGSNIV